MPPPTDDSLDNYDDSTYGDYTSGDYTSTSYYGSTGSTGYLEQSYADTSYYDDGSLYDGSYYYGSYSSYDEYGSYSSYSGSTFGSTSGSTTGSESMANQPQGFHFYIGAAYDFEIGNAYISYCEGAYTGSASIWTIGSSYWTNNYATGSNTLARTDCWFDPELVLSLDMLVPSSISSFIGEVQYFETMLF